MKFLLDMPVSPITTSHIADSPQVMTIERVRHLRGV